MGSQNATKQREMERAFRRQKGRCHLCGGPMNLSKDLDNEDRATADHLIPKSLGGWVKGNIKAAHARCNKARGNRPVYEFREQCTT
jgi:5-methylcytosine-specific restriction endonuclease McrA